MKGIKRASQICPKFESVLEMLLDSGEWQELARPAFVITNRIGAYFIQYLAVKDDMPLLACCTRLLPQPDEIELILDSIVVDNPNFLCLIQTYAGYDVAMKVHYNPHFVITDLNKCKFFIENS
jgi:hypothetical protein